MVRIAMIGCGAGARTFVSAAEDLPEVVITAIADPDREKVVLAAKAAATDVHASSLDELLETAGETFDAVIITTAADTHDQTVSRALQAEKHVLVEPPLAIEARQAKRAAELSRSAGVRLMIAQPARFQADHLAVKESLDKGELGRPGLLRIHQWCSAKNHNRYAALGAVDLALWIFNDLPTNIYALVRPEHASLEHADYTQIHFGFPDGGMGLIDLTQRLPNGDGYNSVNLIGSLGAAHADDHHNMQLLYGGGHAQALLTEPDESIALLELAEFAACIAEKRDPKVCGSDGHAALFVSEAVESSLAASAAVALFEGRYEQA